MKQILLLTPFLLLLACQDPVVSDEPASESPPAPELPTDLFADVGPEAQLLGPGVISTRFNELNGCLSPDGKLFLYSVDNPGADYATILQLELDAEGHWQGPEVASFSGRYSDVDPIWAPDGKRLFFCSNRPAADTGRAEYNHDIWYTERTDAGWSEAKNIGPDINTSRNDWYASSTKEGVLYFSTWDSVRRTDDIFRATPGPDGYTVENLGDSINTFGSEYDPFIAPDGSYLLFSSYRRGNMGSSDLFISHWKEDHWTKARRLPAGINSAGQDYCPYVTADGKVFTFTRMAPKQSYYRDRAWTWSELQERFDEVDNGDGNVFYMLAEEVVAEK